MYQITFFKQAAAEYKRLNNSQKLIVDKGINRIKIRGVQAGHPLHGSLAGCYKIKHRQAGLRIVFRAHPTEIEIIQIIAIGKRARNQVYRTATKRI